MQTFDEIVGDFIFISLYIMFLVVAAILYLAPIWLIILAIVLL